MAEMWKKQRQEQLIKQYGPKKAGILDNKYHFPLNYSDDYSADVAIDDIDHMETVSEAYPLTTRLYFSSEKKEQTLHLRLFQWQKLIPLSDIVPLLENLNLRTDNERPYDIELVSGQRIWISDFIVTYPNPNLNLDTITHLFQDAFVNIYGGRVENDGFNKLVLNAALSWREIMILRAYAKYLRQIEFRFSQSYIEKIVTTHATIAKNLIQLFLILHDPAKVNKAKSQAMKMEQTILQAIERITSLDEDRMLRQLLNLIRSTLRTNYFQMTPEGKNKEYFALKLDSRAIVGLPLPVPLYEIFVYSPSFEAIHLRNTTVARGGIRWSDRLEDFRTEILGLMKAQKVKNAIIVPSGAKGGFVLKGKETVIRCYQLFIQGLLDLTDNIKEKKILRPPQVVCYDDVDPYLVVAADKGTATFSDAANALSNAYHFWLGDAFASGGSMGYDHKKIGITARGAWESIKRHCRECEMDVKTTSIHVIGIGDMSGDVFGNGMLYSDTIKLVGAFDHRHIFLDPNPDPARSYQERKRLFQLPSSSWEDYKATLISKGGGVFARTLKSIPLSPQIQERLDIKETALPPNELIRALLKAPVELLFNGGIGTYVKASTEENTDVGDRSNDYCRVNGKELRCKIVGEGGNLGLTQLARVEYALNGGLINTDFIDNSAGVDCSDHEVNLKILLDKEVHHAKLSQKKRNELLVSVTHEIASLVLKDNYYQALVMSFSAFHAKKNIGLHADYIRYLESIGLLNRSVEYLPDDKKLVERKAAGEGLTRPELAVLLAYTKIHIKHEMLTSNLSEDTYLSQIVETAFPAAIRKKYRSAMDEHPLRANIIATQLSNRIVNEMGITFVYRLQMETGATVSDIVRAHEIASNVFETRELKKLIGALDFKILLSEQYEILYNLRQLVNLSTRWFLHHPRLKEDLHELIPHFAMRVKVIEKLIPNLMSGFTKEYMTSLTKTFLAAGLSEDVARRVGTHRAIYTSLNIIDVATKYNFDLIKTAEIYFSAGEKINLLWFRDQISNDSREGHWNTLARLTLRDELDAAQRALTVAIMTDSQKTASVHQLIQQWVARHQLLLKRWDEILAMLHSSTTIEYTMFFIAVRELQGLIVGSPLN